MGLLSMDRYLSAVQCIELAQQLSGIVVAVRHLVDVQLRQPQQPLPTSQSSHPVHAT